jgi:hypothetical protein
MSTLHTLKAWPVYFEPLRQGVKTFEIRKNDRNFKVGDVLHIQEWNPETELYTGRSLCRVISYVTGFEQSTGWLVLGLYTKTVTQSPQ